VPNDFVNVKQLFANYQKLNNFQLAFIRSPVRTDLANADFVFVDFHSNPLYRLNNDNSGTVHFNLW